MQNTLEGILPIERFSDATRFRFSTVSKISFLMKVVASDGVPRIGDESGIIGNVVLSFHPDRIVPTPAKVG